MKVFGIILLCFFVFSCEIVDKRQHDAKIYEEMIKDKCKSHGGVYLGRIEKDSYFTIYCQDCSIFDIKRFENHPVEVENPNAVNKCK